MACWVFRDFCSRRGENVIRAWLNALPLRVRAKFTQRLLVMQGIPRLGRPYMGLMHGDDWQGIHEVIVAMGRVQYRILACYGPRDGEITLLHGTTERDNRLPPAAKKVAQERRAQIQADRSFTCDHDWQDA